ncbi:MAG TPA: ABC transporter permease, partial [Acidocella sp.]
MSNVVPRSVKNVLAGISWPVYVLLYTPLAMVAFYSFAPAPNSTGYSTFAYGQLFHDDVVFAALQR